MRLDLTRLDSFASFHSTPNLDGDSALARSNYRRRRLTVWVAESPVRTVYRTRRRSTSTLRTIPATGAPRQRELSISGLVLSWESLFISSTQDADTDPHLADIPNIKGYHRYSTYRLLYRRAQNTGQRNAMDMDKNVPGIAPPSPIHYSLLHHYRH